MSWKLNRMGQSRRGGPPQGGHRTPPPPHASPMSHQVPESGLAKSSAGEAMIKELERKTTANAPCRSALRTKSPVSALGTHRVSKFPA